MCKAGYDTAKILIQSTTFDVVCTVELSFEVPTTEFDEKDVRGHLDANRYAWMRGVKLNKDNLARILGMESTKFLFAGAMQNVDLTRINITKYDKNGMVIHREKE